jgi:hypothetical protein
MRKYGRKYRRTYTEDRGKSLYNYKGCWGIPCVVWVIIIILGVLIILVLSGDFSCSIK